MKKIEAEKQDLIQKVLKSYVRHCRKNLMDDNSGLKQYLESKRGLSLESQEKFVIGYFKSAESFKKDLLIGSPNSDAESFNLQLVDTATSLGILPPENLKNSLREGFFTFPWAIEDAIGTKQIVNVWHRYAGAGPLPRKKDHPVWSKTLDKKKQIL